MGRGAEAGGGSVWGGGVLLSNKGGAWGVLPLPRKKKLTFWLKIVHFGVYSDKNSQFSIE